MPVRFILGLLSAVAMGSAAVRVDVRFTPPAPSLSDTIRLEVSITGSGDSNVVLRQADIPADCVIVQAVRDEGARRVLTLDPVKPGVCRIPAFHTRCIGSGTDGCDVQSSETDIPIGTIVMAGGDIRDKEERPVEADTPAPSHIPAWLALLLIPVVCAVLAGVWRRRRRSLAQQALARLRTLPAGDSNPREAFSQLSYILRDYLDGRLALGARNCSSPELIEALRCRSLSHRWTTQVLEEFVGACDHARFSGASGEAVDFDVAREACRTLILVFEFRIARSAHGRI